MKSNLNVNIVALCIMISTLITNFKKKNLKCPIKVSDIEDFKKISIFNIGEEVNNKKDFTGRVWISKLDNIQEGMENVTFDSECKRLWHKHEDQYQIFVVVAGVGEYQIEDNEIKKIDFGDIILVEPGKKHWISSREGSWFSFFSLVIDKKKIQF